MKKKEIEKIPFRGGVRADKQYRNAAVAFLQNIREESHLFVEVYENKKRELQTPWIRMVFTQKDWGLYYPDAGVWSAAGLDEEREKIGSNCKKRDNKCYMARSQGDIVWKFAGDTWERKYTTWVGALQSLIYNIKAQRVQKREDKRADRLKEREQNTPPLPKGLEDWAKKTGIGTEHFLYYKRHGRYADIACSACGQVTEAAVRSKDTYEGQFEKIIPVPQHDSVGTCPHCGATGIYKAQGKAKGVWGHGMNCFIAQRYKDDGAVIRYVEIEKIYRLDTFLDEKERMIGAGEKMIITEIARTYLEKGKRPQTDYHKFSSYSGEFWDDCNLCGMNNISIKAAKIYPESYKELRTTFLRYSAAEMYGKHKTMYNLKEYLERYIQWPQIEMFVKMGLYHIAESIVEGYCGIIADKDAIKPECFLGIYKRRLRDLKTLQGNPDYLKVWQMEKRMGLHVTVQESIFLAESQVRQSDLKEILKYTTVAKFMHRIEQYSGCGIPDTMQEPMCGRMASAVSGVTRTYVDYLHMRIQRGYDLHNQIFLFPRDLRLAHDQMVIETKEKLGNAKTWLRGKGNDAITGLKNGWEAVRESTFLSRVKKIGSQSFNAIGDIKSKVTPKGRDIISGMRTGLNNNWSSLSGILSNIPGKVANAIPSLYTVGQNVIQTFANGFSSIHIPMPHIGWDWEGGSIKIGNFKFSLPRFNLKWYANGGFPGMGEMFVARESGPELVGRMGNRSAVANNNQIIAGIRAGVFEAVVNAFESMQGRNDRGQELHIYLEGDAKKLFKVIRQEGNNYQKQTGNPVFG